MSLSCIMVQVSVPCPSLYISHCQCAGRDCAAGSIHKKISMKFLGLVAMLMYGCGGDITREL